MERKPDWLKVRLPSGPTYTGLKALLRRFDLHTVCEEAACPNMGECWGGGTATVMLLGEVCTRGCRFCHVTSGNPRGVVDPEEPEKVGEAIAGLGLRYVVLTSVDRDDLPDGGADHFARTVEVIKEKSPDMLVEVLIPDFLGDEEALERILRARPDVVGHNVETVERLTPVVRDRRCSYALSLGVLALLKERSPSTCTKSSIMLGLGETGEEIETTLRDLRSVGCDVVTLGQYLRPGPKHLPVSAYVHPEAFKTWRRRAEEIGFLYAAAGPLVRSSYRAGEFFQEARLRKERKERKERCDAGRG